MSSVRVIWRPSNDDESGGFDWQGTTNHLIDKAPDILQYIPVDGRVGDAIARGVQKGTENKIGDGLKFAGAALVGVVVLTAILRSD